MCWNIKIRVSSYSVKLTQVRDLRHAKYVKFSNSIYAQVRNGVSGVFPKLEWRTHRLCIAKRKEFSRATSFFAISHGWLKSGSVHLKMLLHSYKRTYVHYPGFHLSSRYYTRDSPRCPHSEDFSLYLRSPDPLRTRVAKVVAKCTAASVSPR